MANDFSVTSNADDLERSLENMLKGATDFTDPFKKFGKYMQGEISNRVTNSKDAEGRKWLGIKFSSLHSSNRAKRFKKWGTGKRGGKTVKHDPDARVPLSVVRPLLTKSQDARRSVYKITDDGRAFRLSPTMGSRGSKADTVLSFHHSPKYSGHPTTTGKMPDRSVHYRSKADTEMLLKYMVESIHKEMKEATRGTK